MPKQINDKVILERIVRGDSTGLSDLYDRYKTLIFSIAFNILGNNEDAEDVTIDVFSKIWEKAESYASRRATVKVWIASIARNRSIDALRRRNARLTLHSPKWADACLDCLPALENPEEDLEMAMVRKTITEALAQLPENQRDALSLSYFKGYSHNQIAEALSEPLGTVKTRIRSAMQTLHKLLTVDKKEEKN